MIVNGEIILYELTVGYEWNEGRGDRYTFGSLERARADALRKAIKGDVRWFSIEGHKYLPCQSDDPQGQLYIGVTHMEFHDVTTKDGATTISM